MSRRLFFGLELPDAWKTQLRDVQRSLQAKSVEAGAWSNPALLHITVLFLGVVPDESLPAIHEAGAAAARMISPIRLVTGKYGAFARNQVFWLGLAHDETDWPRLVELNKRVTEQVLDKLVLDLDNKHYRPHITLARKLRQRTDVTRLPQPNRLETVVPELCLFESLRVDGELTYPVRARFPFIDPAVPLDVFPRNT